MILSYTALEDYARRSLEAAGVARAKAAIIAESLVIADLRGVESHGVQLLPFYLDQIKDGNIDAAADGHVVSETGCCLTYDAENGLGAPVSAICCEHANRLAKTHGMAMVLTRESNHFGACAYWAQRISAAGNIGIVMCNASPMVPPWQGREPRLGTNPICVSVPGDPESAWLLDMATTTVAAGKIYKAVINGIPEIPPGWGLDCDGRPTTDPRKALDGGSVHPLGGYKGSGLAMMVEILGAVLSGGAMATQLGGIRIKGRPMRVSQTFIAIDVARFMPVDEFLGRMDWLTGVIKSTAPAAEFNEVLIAGEPELREAARRRVEGVRILDGTWTSLEAHAARLGVAVPLE